MWVLTSRYTTKWLLRHVILPDHENEAVLTIYVHVQWTAGHFWSRFGVNRSTLDEDMCEKQFLHFHYQ